MARKPISYYYPADVENMVTEAYDEGFEAGQNAVIESMEGAPVRMTYEPLAYVPGGLVARGSRARYPNTFAQCVGRFMRINGPWKGKPQKEIRAAFKAATQDCKGTRGQGY